MNTWAHAPFLKLLLPFVFGILMGMHPLWPPLVPYLLLATAISLLLTCFLWKEKLKFFRIHAAFGVSTTLILFCLGLELCQIQQRQIKWNDLETHSAGREVFRLNLVSEPLEKETTVKVMADLHSVQEQNVWRPCRGKLILHLHKTKASQNLKRGDVLVVCCRIAAIPAPPNPGMFDYRAYMAKSGIGYQAFCDSTAWGLLRKGNTEVSCMTWCLQIRSKLITVMKKAGLSGNELAVGSALLFGYEDKLDPDLLRAYSVSGVTHVLSVSGMHVAIIFTVLNTLLFLLDRLLLGRIAKTLLLLAFLWFYAALTGLSPAVLRSVTMLSFVVVGKGLNRNTNLLNTLSASAFFLLCWNPILILDIGFQLSYAAVAGIIFLVPALETVWLPEGWLLRKIGALVTVSIAAQAATLPLSIFYFHQMPNYFLIANLIIIPLSTVVIYAGIVFFLFSPIIWFGTGLAWVFSKSLLVLNGSVLFLSSLPGACLKGIYISVPEVILFYLFIFQGVHILSLRKVQSFRPLLVLLCICTCGRIAHRYQQLHQTCAIVFNLPGNTCLDLLVGQEDQVCCGKTALSKASTLQFFVEPFRAEKGIRKKTIQLLGEGIDLVYWQGKQFIMLAKVFEGTCPRLNCDYLILRKGSFKSAVCILNQYEKGILILDSSCDRQERAGWKALCHSRGIAFWCVFDSGAFLVVPDGRQHN
jgi:competence protein ComEC